MIMVNQYAKHTRSIALSALLPVRACGSQSSNKHHSVNSFFYNILLFTTILSVLPFAVNAIDENSAEINEPLMPHDFAYGIPLSFSGQDALYQIAKDWINNLGGVFQAEQSSVRLTGPNESQVLGSNTFHNLIVIEPSKTVTFEAGATQEITGTLTLSGGYGKLLYLRSSS